MPSARVLRGGELLKQNHTAYATIPSYYAWRQRPIGKGVPKSVEQTCDDLAILILAVVAVVAGLTFRDYGLGWDDYTHAEYADLLLRMYGSGFKDTGALSFANLYMYGGGFDMAAALLHKLIPLELFETRRLLGAAVGVIGLAVTWRLAR